MSVSAPTFLRGYSVNDTETADVERQVDFEPSSLCKNIFLYLFVQSFVIFSGNSSGKKVQPRAHAKKKKKLINY